MKKIATIFNYKKFPPRPLMSAIFDTQERNVEFLPLYMPDVITIRKVRENIDKIKSILQTNTVIIDDVLSHVLEIIKPVHAKQMQISNFPPKNYEIYESRLPLDNTIPESIDDTKKLLLKKIISMPKKPAPWMKTKADAGIVYAYLTHRGLMYGPRPVFPHYDTRVLSGRSRTTNFNIQGTTQEDLIKHPDPDRTHMICFDWVSADVRMAGYLSLDKFINHSFHESDPYTEITKQLNMEDINRDDCKLEVLRSIYKVDLSSPLLDMMPGLKAWLSQKYSDFDDNYNFKTILGMPVPKDTLRSSVNGIIQGSVAEALQSAMSKISRIDIDCILTEIHDSLIISSSESDVPKIIDKIVPIMMKPFDNTTISMPVKVSIGKRWKNWKEYKVFR